MTSCLWFFILQVQAGMISIISTFYPGINGNTPLIEWYQRNQLSSSSRLAASSGTMFLWNRIVPSSYIVSKLYNHKAWRSFGSVSSHCKPHVTNSWRSNLREAVVGVIFTDISNSLEVQCLLVRFVGITLTALSDFFPRNCLEKLSSSMLGDNALWCIALVMPLHPEDTNWNFTI